MLTISDSMTADDVSAALRLIRMMAAWDAEQSAALGIAAPEVLDYHYDLDEAKLRQSWSAIGAGLLVGRWDGAVAGCIAFGPFERGVVEIQKFFVDPAFRGHGIGKMMLGDVLARLPGHGYRTAVLQTAAFMKTAIALYESAGFRRCAPFREIPDSFIDMEVFMERSLVGQGTIRPHLA